MKLFLKKEVFIAITNHKVYLVNANKGKISWKTFKK
jgi:hypothetical protein